jgi:hypothetical protein
MRTATVRFRKGNILLWQHVVSDAGFLEADPSDDDIRDWAMASLPPDWTAEWTAAITSVDISRNWMSNAEVDRTVAEIERRQAVLLQRERLSLHTPGPWAVSRHDDIGFEHPDGEYIDVVSATNEHIYICTVGDVTHRANILPDARLIAAAPELLAVLKEWDDMKNWNSGGDFIGERELFKRTTDAIAKATGSPGPASLPVTEKG